MSDKQDLDELRAGLIAAVQAELNRHAAAVQREIDKLRDEGVREREALRSAFGEHVRTLAGAVEAAGAKGDQVQASLRDAIDKQAAQAEERTNRRLDEMMSTIERLVDAAARPLLTDVRDEQDKVGRRIDVLDENLRRFDEQAARMVRFFDEQNQALVKSNEDAQAQLAAHLDARADELTARIDTAVIEAVRHKSETTQVVVQRVADLEDRLNARILAAETRAKEDAGTRIAEIDAHLGRVSSGLDGTLNVINDRLSEVDGRFADTESHIEALAADVAKVDTEAISDLKERMSAAAGEAMLVRIEMERFEKASTEKIDAVTLRVTDVETQLADATMDVSTAVQLERLEELERAVLEIDPSTFVRTNGARGHQPVPAVHQFQPPIAGD
jgi:CII-binding regulator of phage lambda lysogenization HflD